MRQYNQYPVRDTDHFDPEYFPAVSDEVIKINLLTEHLPALLKAGMIVSFLKDHSLQTDWVKANPELADLVTSGSLFTGTTEFLFESCRDNLPFRQQLEIYLMNRFSETGLPAGKR